MKWLREPLKTALTFAPTDLLDIVTNYAVLRKDGGRLLPPESVTGSKTVLYEQAHRLVVAPPGGPGSSENDRPASASDQPPTPGAISQSAPDARPDDPPPILFLEFGVFEGNSIRRWSGLNAHPDSRFVGFDSFEGLPTKWRQRPAGHFSTDGQPPEVDDPRVSFVKGWFYQTVPGFLDDLKDVPGAEAGKKTPGTRSEAEVNIPGAGARALPCPCPTAKIVIHIDADLFTSAMFLLTALHRHFDRYYVLFDDYAAGEARALDAYLTAYGAEFQPLLGRKRHPRAFVPNQAFGLLTTHRPRK